MKTLSYSQLIEKLAKGGARPVSLLTVTDAKARKTGNPFGIILKHSASVGFVGAEYGASVRREGVARQGKDDADTFTAEPRPWGQWVIPSRVASHKGSFYLRTQSTPGQRKRQAARVLAYTTQSGERITREQAAPFLPAPSYSAKQASVGMDAPESQVCVREYKFESIKKIRLNGETFVLIPDPVTSESAVA